MDNFNAHKWFKKQYLEEAKIDEAMMSREEAFKALRDVEANMRGKVDDRYIKLMMVALDSLQADEVKVMMDRERANKSVTFSDIRENMSPGEAVTELNYYMNDLQDISAAVSRIMQQTFPGEYRRGEAYGAFDFGSSRNQFDITFESILDSLASVGDEDEME
jgi:hypothetical protein